MIELFEAGRDIQAFCDSQDWRSCFIGGIAVPRWSEPRVTRDVDLTLLTGFGREETFIQALLSKFQARISDAGAFALQKRVLLLQTRKESPSGTERASIGATPKTSSGLWWN